MSCYPTPSDHSHHHLILFGRYPIPGRTKTRLIPLLGEVGAAEWHRCQVERSLAAILETCSAYTVMFCYTGAGQAKVRRWLGSKSLHLVQQIRFHKGGIEGCRAWLWYRAEIIVLWKHWWFAGGHADLLIQYTGSSQSAIAALQGTRQGSGCYGSL